jgi:hypothetical protein
MIDIQETQEWYANERNIKVDEFDDYDAHVCKVVNAYGNVVKKLTIPVVVGQREMLIDFSKYLSRYYDIELLEIDIDSYFQEKSINSL